MQLRTIRSLDEIWQLIKEYEGRLYVRWSRYPLRDIQRGRSYDHAHHQWECGLSCVAVTGKADVEWDDPERQREADYRRLIRQLTAYAMLRFGQPNVKCWLLTGDVVGPDSDGCPAVINAEPVGVLSKRLTEFVVAEDKRFREAERQGAFWC